MYCEFCNYKPKENCVGACRCSPFHAYVKNHHGGRLFSLLESNGSTVLIHRGQKVEMGNLDNILGNDHEKIFAQRALEQGYKLHRPGRITVRTPGKNSVYSDPDFCLQFQGQPLFVEVGMQARPSLNLRSWLRKERQATTVMQLAKIPRYVQILGSYEELLSGNIKIAQLLGEACDLRRNQY